jgi:WD40 repeat protein
MSSRVREETVRRRNLILLVQMLAVLCLLGAMPVSAKQKVDWKTYRLDVGNVHGCAFTPDSRHIAFTYWTSQEFSEKPWRVTEIAHLALWNFETGKMEEKLKWSSPPLRQGESWPAEPISVQYTANGRYLIILEDAAIRVLDATTYAEVKQIAIEPPKEKIPDDAWAVVKYFGPGFSLTRDGSRAAVAISSSIGANGGFVRVYDLKSGQIVREWRLHDGVRYVSGVALSSDGERVAVSSLPVERSSDPEAFIPSGTENVRVMDVKTGDTVAGVNTKYVAGPVLFGPSDTLLTASINDDRKGYALDTVKVWDARTGKLLREITDPRTGVHYRLDLSPDGKLLLGYTGTEKPVENFVNIDSQQFQIWDFASGKAVAASPKILPIKNGPPQLQLSPDGKFVVVWWGDGFAKPVVYEIPQR